MYLRLPLNTSLINMELVFLTPIATSILIFWFWLQPCALTEKISFLPPFFQVVLSGGSTNTAAPFVELKLVPTAVATEAGVWPGLANDCPATTAFHHLPSKFKLLLELIKINL